MLKQGARIAVVLSSLLFACGGATNDSPDGGTAGAGVGSGGNAGAGGSTPTGGGGTGGVAGDGGAGAHPGDGGQGPHVALIRDPKIKSIDLLFMIDNSSSMVDKQTILATAVPELVGRLIEPKCIDSTTGRVVGPAVNGVCAIGVLEFEPVKDIHIGIVTSSIGNHGASGVCEDAIDISLGRSDPHNNDQGRLVARGTGGTSVPTFLNKGFLYYNPSIPGGLASAAAVVTPFADMVKGVGQHGCGYEASLESVYRFLIDPEPYATIRIDTSIGGFGQALLNGTDTMLLQQRKDFLRPDSLVSIVLVTDENDCSIVDGGQGFYPILPPLPGTGRSVLKGGTSVCRDNPNDKCCFNCGQQAAPVGCAPAQNDPACQQGELRVIDDQPNLRCFNQKQRYGVDFLYPVQRYIDGFTKPLVPNRKSEMVANPLFADLSCTSGCPSQRDKGLVFVTGIVGVPWQDIAVDASDLSAGFKTARQIDNEGIWSDVVGDPQNATGPIPPRDTHMVESIAPRAGLPGPGSARDADPKNGHEWLPADDESQPNADLQFACVFDLVPPKVCVDGRDCDCFGPSLAKTQNPLCQNAAGAYTTTQVRAKAYPSPRILQVLQGIGDQAIVGSICPAQTTDKSREDYGYSPALRAIISRLRAPLAGRCLPIALPIDSVTEGVPCAVIEAFSAPTCRCADEPGRRPAVESQLTDDMKLAGNCFCEILQTVGDVQQVCRSNANPPANTGNGWCYVDPAQQSGASCDLVSTCAKDEQRKIRFINANSEPRPGAYAFLRCEAAPIAPLTPRCQ
jgi:hypothetical protein